MKYLVLIYSNPVNWEHPMFLHQQETLAPDERDAQLAEFSALLTEIAESGELVGSGALGDPASARTLRNRDGVLTATDGPFIDAKEHLAGYFLLDCASGDRAAEIAARFPDTRHGAVEVRPVLEFADHLL
ncbi:MULTISPECIES: YciI family protein [unclassified Solwaraspora]|uniref:YciI family protein n=1 Tax=unclassified Solwaraspora TaxID=2627926 RepID=UPI00259AF20F|nr:YciI family protein [Solwaraspora sp. WMMA2056]WJK38622.1 YciI family protein [Solwaraspora sp. WMMA2056]